MTSYKESLSLEEGDGVVGENGSNAGWVTNEIIFGFYIESWMTSKNVDVFENIGGINAD